MSGIYRILNSLNGDCYVGQSGDIHHRWGRHLNQLRNGKHPNKHLQRAWDKYGEPCFVFEVLEQCEDLDASENHFIATLQSSYNIECFARGTGPRSEEARENMRRARLGRINSPETRRRISEALKGRKKPPISEEHRRNLSRSHAGKAAGSENPFHGKTHSEEARVKMRGRRLTPEQRQAISDRQRGRILSEEHKRKIGDAMRGENNPFFGRHHSEATKDKLKGPKSPETVEKIRAAKKGSKMSSETRDRMSQAQKERRKREGCVKRPEFGSEEDRKRRSESQKLRRQREREAREIVAEATC